MTSRLIALAWTLATLTLSGMARAVEERPIEGISDNSFLIEEAYNQEAGVVQHIFGALYFQHSPLARHTPVPQQSLLDAPAPAC